MASGGDSNKNDWFAELDTKLEERTRSIIRDVRQLNSQRGKISKTLVEDFARIQDRFGKIDVHISMEPAKNVFSEPASIPGKFVMKNDFNYADLNSIQLIDRTQGQGRMGDSLKIWYYDDEQTARLRMIFEYCEGEHYYRLAGWKRIYGQFIIYDSPVNEVNIDTIHEALAEVVAAWYESHLYHNRELFISSLREKFEKGENFTE